VVEKLLAWLGIESATLDLDSQSGAFDHLAMASSYEACGSFLIYSFLKAIKSYWWMFG